MTMKPNRKQWRTARTILVRTPLVAVGVALLTTSAFAQWPQWGGANRDFMADAKDLASAWPESGPKRLWTKDLGAGYSSIAFVDGRLYTMCCRGDDEVVVSLDAKSGETVWENKYAAPLPEGMDPQFGRGPRSTPLVVGGRVYTLGVGGRLQCLDQKTGAVIWAHDLVSEAGAKSPDFGFASSPLAYKNSLIAVVGGPGCGVMSFDLASGSVLWRKHDFVNTYSSPITIAVDGKDEIVLLVDREVVGFDPTSGDIEWRFPHVNEWKTNIATPLWGNDHILTISSGGDAGTRGLKITRKDGKFAVEEVWSTRKMQIGQSSAVRVGDYIYGCSGSESVFFVTAVNATNGQVAWRERGFGKSNLLYGDGKLILLDEDGTLALATATPEALKVQSKVNLLKKSARVGRGQVGPQPGDPEEPGSWWTTPTLVGQRLFVRDNETIMALDLGSVNGGRS